MSTLEERLARLEERVDPALPSLSPRPVPYGRLEPAWRAAIVLSARQWRAGGLWVEFRMDDFTGPVPVPKHLSGGWAAQGDQIAQAAALMSAHRKRAEEARAVMGEFRARVESGEITEPGSYLSGHARVFEPTFDLMTTHLFMPRRSPRGVYLGPGYVLADAPGSKDQPGPTRDDYVLIREGWSGDLDGYLDGVRQARGRPVVHLVHDAGICPRSGCSHPDRDPMDAA